MERDPKELGQLVRDRRIDLGMSQVEVAGRATISEPAYRALETGRTRAADRTLSLVSVALGWPQTALRQLREGATLESIEGQARIRDQLKASMDAGLPQYEVTVSASGVNLDELRDLDPDAYDLIVLQAKAALERARRREQQRRP